MTAKELSDALSPLLTGAGLVPDEIDRLFARLEQYPDKWPFILPLDLSEPIHTFIRLATVPAADRDSWNTSLPVLLTYVEDRLDALDDFHLGIFWHLRGYLAWKSTARRYPAIRHLNRSVEALRRAASGKASAYLARVYDTAGQVAYANGYFSEAIKDYQEALRINQQAGDSYSEALTYGNVGRLYMEMGEFEAAYHYLHRDLSLVNQHFPLLTRIQAQLLSHCGACLLEQGLREESRIYYHRSLKLSRQDNNPVGEVYALIGLGKVALAGFDPQGSAAFCAQARQVMETHAEKGAFGELPGLLQHLLGKIHHANGELEKAAEAFEKGNSFMLRGGPFSPIQRALFLIDYAGLTRERGRANETAALLQEALSALDSTAAEQLRQKTQEALKNEQPQAWLYHAIRRFTGRGQIESLLEEAGQSGFRGSAHEVAVLFTDIRNFTGISEQLDPEDVILFLNELLSCMIRSVAHFDGHIDKILGDSLMAIFSLPQPRPDDAEQALLTALMMREELRLFNARRPKDLPPLATGAGIHFGKVVAGLIGSPLKRSYTVIGDSVNIASRLEEMTKTLGGAILVSDALVRQIPNPDRYLFRPLGRFRPRGREEAIDVIEVAGEQDHSPEALRISSEIEQTRQVLAWFYGRRFDRAAAGFAQLFEQTQLPAYHRLSQAADKFRVNPPGEAWRGEV